MYWKLEKNVLCLISYNNGTDKKEICDSYLK